MARRYSLPALAAIAALGLLLVPAARAVDYGTFIEVESEEDILDLLAAGDLDEGDAEALIELLEVGVSLDRASREELYALPNLTYADVDAILDYRQDAGTVPDPLNLVVAGALDEKKLLAIAPFLLLEDKEPGAFETRGRFRYRTAYVAGDDRVPSMMLSAKVSTLKNLDLGLIGVLTHGRIGDIRYDPNRDALSAEGPAVRAHLPKFYLQWNTTSWQVVAGTYRIGFGQRLTFDNTTLYTPNGIKLDETINMAQDLANRCRETAGELPSPCLDEDFYQYGAPDYRWTDRLRGIAAGFKHAEAGPGWFQGYGFLSFQTHSPTQYQIYRPDRCDDPFSDDPECSAPDLFLRRGDPLANTTELKWAVLPDMYNELLGGANFSYFFNRRTHVGVTGYGADLYWLTQGIELDLQDWARLPFGGPFGAVGLDAAWGQEVIDLFLELTRSFDSQPAGGGWAAMLRATATWKKHEFEATARYFDQDFNNPYARPIAADDQNQGLRASDEAGVRLKYTGDLGDLDLRAALDLWAQLSGEIPRTFLYVRASYEVEQWFKPGLYFDYKDKDLSDTGRDNCYVGEGYEDEGTGEPTDCKGEKIRVGLELKFQPLKRLGVTAKYQHAWVDDGGTHYPDSRRQDISAWVTAMYKPIDGVRLRLRVRYLNEGIAENDYLEQSVWAYLEGAYWYERYFGVKLRYEVYAIVDERDSTRQRSPNPAHWLRLELEYRF